MTFEEFMAGIEAERPEVWRADKVQVSVASLRAQLRRAYGAGYDQGAETAQPKRPSDMPEFMKGLFGRR